MQTRVKETQKYTKTTRDANAFMHKEFNRLFKENNVLFLR